MGNLNQSSQLEMLTDQMLRCDEEMLIFIKRRVQTAKKMADVVKKQDLDRAQLKEILDMVHLKTASKSREMNFDMIVTTEFLGIIEDLCIKTQKEVLEK